MQPNQETKNRGLSSIVFTVLALGLISLAWFKQDAIYDLIRLHGYTPPAAVAALASDTTMTPNTQRLFYVNHPALEDRQTFNAHCQESEQTIVLGCYVGRRGIYLYDVTDERLHGVEQVTAAHETLHAAYERLSPRERKNVDAMTARAFSEVKDQRILDTIENYRKKDPNVVLNELHSILGTEVRNLPADLEQYYKKYFKDRSAIVHFSEQYENEFTSREQQREAYDKQLAELKKSIESLSDDLTSREQQITNEYQALLKLKQSGKVDQYNAGVPTYNAHVNSYNNDVAKLQEMTKQYNDIVKKRNDLVVEEGELLQAIDSRPKTIQQQ